MPANSRISPGAYSILDPEEFTPSADSQEVTKVVELVQVADSARKAIAEERVKRVSEQLREIRRKFTPPAIPAVKAK
jgi:hypothetical protein